MSSVIIVDDHQLWQAFYFSLYLLCLLPESRSDTLREATSFQTVRPYVTNCFKGKNRGMNNRSILDSDLSLAISGKKPLLLGIMSGGLAEDFRQLLNTELTPGGINLSSKFRMAVIPAPFEDRTACIGFHHFSFLSWCPQANESSAFWKRWEVILMKCQGRK